MSLIKESFRQLNLPRIGAPLRGQSRSDYEKVASGRASAQDELKTAGNNGIAAVESLGKAVAAPLISIGIGLEAAFAGKVIPYGPGAPDEGLSLLSRVCYGVGGFVFAAGVPVVYGVQAAADLGQGALALARAGVRAAVDR
jgi:hypothetical protein